MFYQVFNQFINFISPIFYKVLYMTIIGSFVGVITYFIRNILDKKISSKWKCIMWLIVLFSLLIPVRFELKINRKFPQNDFISQTENIKNIYEPIHINEELNNLNFTEVENNEKQVLDSNETIKYSKQIDIKECILNIIIPSIWLIGVIINIIIFIMGIKNMNSQKYKNICNDERLNNIFEKCKTELNISKKIKLVLQNSSNVPSIYGIINTKILITENFTKENDQTIRYVFLHELSHYKRKDILLNYILLFIVSIHWFNPIIWFLFKNIRQDIELGADELVLDKLNKTEKKEYGFTLINSLKNIEKENYVTNLLCISDNSKNMKRRIHMIKLGSKNKIISGIIVILILGIIGGVVFVNITQKEEVLEVSKDEYLQTEQTSYEKVWKEPKKFNSYQEYSEYNLQENSKYNDRIITEEDLSKVISEEDATARAKEILKIVGFEKPYVGKPELHKNWASGATLCYEIKANDTLSVCINAENGKIIWFDDNSFLYNTYKTDVISEEEATQIGKDLFNKLGFNEEEYSLVSVKERSYASNSVYNQEWSALFCKISDEKVLNHSDLVAISFIKESGELKIAIVNVRKDIDSYEDNPIVITEEQAIEIAKEKDRKLSNENIKNIKTELSLNMMNTFVWATENNLETSASETIINEKGEEESTSYPIYYFDENRVRKTYVVSIEYDVENTFEQGRSYYVDTTTGEIIGGSWIFEYQ